MLYYKKSIMISKNNMTLMSSINFTLCECWDLSPNIISTTFSPYLVVVVFKVTSSVFSNAL